MNQLKRFNLKTDIHRPYSLVRNSWFCLLQPLNLELPNIVAIHSWYFINRSNHLNGPDFEALETASVASCSSAYSSKSESSVMSPPCGSVTELSDTGSCDTFQEYEISSRRPGVSDFSTKILFSTPLIIIQ